MSMNTLQPISPQWNPSSNEGSSVERALNSTSLQPKMSGDPNNADDQTLSSKDITRSLQRVNKALQTIPAEIHLEWDKDINRVIIKMKNPDTGEVIRQIPPEQFVAWAKEFTRLVGLLFDKQV